MKLYEAGEILESAIKAIKKGRRDEGIYMLQDLISNLEPDSAEAMKLLADANYQLIKTARDTDSMVDYIEKGIRILEELKHRAPKNVIRSNLGNLYLKLGNVYSKRREHKKVLECYYKAIENLKDFRRSKDLFFVYSNLASEFEKMNDLIKSIRYSALAIATFKSCSETEQLTLMERREFARELEYLAHRFVKLRLTEPV